MRVSKDLFEKLEELYSQYEKEIPNAKERKCLKRNMKKSYLLRNNNFMKWLKHDFESREKNKEN